MAVQEICMYIASECIFACNQLSNEYAYETSTVALPIIWCMLKCNMYNGLWYSYLATTYLCKYISVWAIVSYEFSCESNVKINDH